MNRGRKAGTRNIWDEVMGESQSHAIEPTELAVDYTLAVRVPRRQPAYVVTVADWNRIKEAIRSIHSTESIWLTAMWSCFSFGVSFIVGLLALERQAGAASGLRASFLAITVAGFVAGIVCFAGYIESRRRRRGQAAVAVRYMEEIETISDSP